MKGPLSIATYDGSGQLVHPDVLHIPEGFLGYPYWLAMTPYPHGNDRLENPSLRASIDGYRWVRVPSVPDPVVNAPDDPMAHHADPDLAYDGERMHMIFISVDKRRAWTTMTRISSADGRDWTSPSVVLAGPLILSPTQARGADGIWRLWYVTDPSGRTTPGGAHLECLTGTSLEHLDTHQVCDFSIPGFVLWHVDVISTAVGFEMLACAYPKGLDNSRTQLFHAMSTDGIAFQLSSNRPVMRPRVAAWNNRMVYRSTLLKGPDGYRIWYSGASWGLRFGVGLVEGPLHNLQEAGPRQRRINSTRVAEDVAGWLNYLVGRRLPRPLARAVVLVLRKSKGR